MNIQLRYFASLREAVGRDSETLEWEPDASPSAADVIERLRARGGRWAEAFAADNPLMCAINQEMCDPGQRLKEGDELALFPPVTGG